MSRWKSARRGQSRQKEILQGGAIRGWKKRIRASMQNFRHFKSRSGHLRYRHEIGDRAIFSGIVKSSRWWPRSRACSTMRRLCCAQGALRDPSAEVNSFVRPDPASYNRTDTRFILPASKCCLQLPFGSRLTMRALRGGHRSRGEAGCIGVVRK